MKVTIQRVSKSSVTIDDTVKSSIKVGLLVLVGIEDSDNEEDIKWLSTNDFIKVFTVRTFCMILLLRLPLSILSFIPVLKQSNVISCTNYRAYTSGSIEVRRIRIAGNIPHY